MYNPFALLSPALLKAVIKQPKIFVREYYQRGLPNGDNKNLIPLLLTCYDKLNNVEHSRALFHFKQLQAAPFSYLYQWESENDRTKLLIAATQPNGYRIYINMLPRAWVPPVFLRKKIHNYMLHHLHWWHYSKTHQLHIHLKDKYGKLYVQLSWKGNRAEVLLEEIENFSVCATT